MNNPVAVTHKAGSDIARLLRAFSSAAVFRQTRKPGKVTPLAFFFKLADVHNVITS